MNKHKTAGAVTHTHTHTHTHTRRIKNEKGAVTLLVLVTILFFVAFLITTYMIMVNKAKSQKEVVDQTRQIYNSVSAEQAYYSYFGDSVVPIYTVDQLLKIGSGASIQINETGGKIYTFDGTATYVLMNDLQFNYGDLAALYNVTNGWTPIGDTNYNFEGNGKTITVAGHSSIWVSNTDNDNNYEFNMGNGYRYVPENTSPNPITMVPDTTEWRNGSAGVTVTITYPGVSGMTNQYSIDGGTTWNTYTQPVKITANGLVYAGYWDGTKINNMSTLNITNIDKIPPTITLSQNTVVTSPKTVTAAISDNESGVSIQKWAYGDQTTDYFASNGTTFSGTFSCENNIVCTVYAKDNAGNETVKTITVSGITDWTQSITAGFGGYPGADGPITSTTFATDKGVYFPKDTGNMSGATLPAGTWNIQVTGTNLSTLAVAITIYGAQTTSVSVTAASKTSATTKLTTTSATNQWSLRVVNKGTASCTITKLRIYK